MKANFRPPKQLTIFTLSIFAAQLFSQNTKNTAPIIVSLYSVAATFNYEGNPILPIYQRNDFRLTNHFFPSNFNFRIGFGYKI